MFERGHGQLPRTTAVTAPWRRRWLLNRVQLCRDTRFGRDHNFAEIKTLADFRKRVPVARYDDFAPYIQSVASGDTSALIPSTERLVQFTITTGSGGTPKLNPVSNVWMKQYRQAWDIWGLKLFCDHRANLGQQMLQLAGKWDMGKTPAGHQISMVSALLAVAVAKKSLDAVWKLSTGKEPPENPAHPEINIFEAVAWAMVTGIPLLIVQVSGLWQYKHRIMQPVVHATTLTPGPSSVEPVVKECRKPMSPVASAARTVVSGTSFPRLTRNS